MKPELCVTTKEAAELLRTSEKTVRRLIKEHKLLRLEGTHKNLIPIVALNRYVQGTMSMTATFERIDVIETESHFAHDRACLYIKDHAAEFLQRVKPAADGYATIAVETGWPIEQRGTVAAWVDLLITGVDIAQDKLYQEAHRSPHLWKLPRALFVEVITWRQPIGDILRKLRHQRIAHEAAEAARYWEHFRYYGEGSDSWYRPLFDDVILVLAAVYQITAGEQREFTDAKIVVVELESESTEGRTCD